MPAVKRWHSGRERLRRRRAQAPVTLDSFFRQLAQSQPPIGRTQGVALFVTSTEEETPWAMTVMAHKLRVLPRQVVVISIKVIEVPHVRPEEQGKLISQGNGDGPVNVLHLRFGFNDHQALPRTIGRHLAAILEPGQLLEATYVVSTSTFEVDDGASRLRRWRQRLYIWTAKWGIDPIRYHDLPPDQTILIGRTVGLQ